jgi:hypothetical protein
MSAQCPELVMLAAYLEGNLTVKEREGILSHLAYCDDCRELVALVVKTLSRDIESDSLVMPPERSNRAGGGAIRKREGRSVVSPYKQVMIKLTDEQQREVQEHLGKEVTHITFRLVSGIMILAEVADPPDPFDGRF